MSARPFIATALFAAAIVTAGCTSTASDPEPSPTISSTAQQSTPSATAEETDPSPESTFSENTVTYASIEELQAAIVAAGQKCAGFTVGDTLEGATAGGTCKNGLTLVLFADGAARDVGLGADQMGDDPGTWLVGRNWLAGYAGDDTKATDLMPLLEAVGGFIVPTGS